MTVRIPVDGERKVFRKDVVSLSLSLSLSLFYKSIFTFCGHLPFYASGAISLRRNLLKIFFYFFKETVKKLWHFPFSGTKFILHIFIYRRLGLCWDSYAGTAMGLYTRFSLVGHTKVKVQVCCIHVNPLSLFIKLPFHKTQRGLPFLPPQRNKTGCLQIQPAAIPKETQPRQNW